VAPVPGPPVTRLAWGYPWSARRVPYAVAVLTVRRPVTYRNDADRQPDGDHDGIAQ
jgi:hypothetical protein